MPHRYQLLEKFAFSLVVLSAVVCSSYIAWASSPDLRESFQHSKELVVKSGEYTYDACVPTSANSCGQFTFQ
jgi:hypothetical protein